MKNNYIAESIISTAIIILLTALVNPFGFWMPSALHMACIIALIVAVGVFAVFIWQENARDEREALLRGSAGRAGFLTGAVALTAGIAYQSYIHALDIWLVYTLAAMVLAKIISLIYSRIKY